MRVIRTANACRYGGTFVEEIADRFPAPDGACGAVHELLGTVRAERNDPEARLATRVAGKIVLANTDRVRQDPGARVAGIAVCLIALGCATTWIRADGSDFYEMQLEIDMESCRVHLETRADVTRPFADCMRARGWVAAPEPDEAS